jgi:hypothetical protein
MAVSDNDIDYKSMVLYYSHVSAPSMELREMLSYYPEVHLQDVRTLPDKPKWLTGVPTLVLLPTLEMFKGSRAVDKAGEWVKTRVRPVQHVVECTMKTWDVSGSWGALQPETTDYPHTRTLEDILRIRSTATPTVDQQNAPLSVQASDEVRV